MSQHTVERPKLNAEPNGVLNAIEGSVCILAISGLLTYRGIETGSLLELVGGSILDLGGLAVAAHIPLRLRRAK